MPQKHKTAGWYITRTVLLLILLAIGNIASSVIINGKSIFGTTRMREGKITSITNNGNYDIGIGIEGDKTHYYINRGTQHGLNIDTLRSKYLGRQLKVYYVDAFIILDPKGRIKHINQLKLSDSLIYTELETPAQ